MERPKNTKPIERLSYNERYDAILARDKYIDYLESQRESDSIGLSSDVRDRLNDFIGSQKPIPQDIQKIINEKFWEMI